MNDVTGSLIIWLLIVAAVTWVVSCAAILVAAFVMAVKRERGKK